MDYMKILLQQLAIEDQPELHDAKLEIGRAHV